MTWIRLAYTVVCCSIGILPFSSQAAQWMPYQKGAALQLAIDKKALRIEKEGLVHFVNQEKYSKAHYENAYKLYYYIRRITGYADCPRSRFALVSTDYFDQYDRLLYSTLFPVVRDSWEWQSVVEGSVAAAMMEAVCQAAASLTP